RGAVWEEVIIHLPRHVRLVALSATVSNAEEFGDWIQTVRGDTEVIVSEDRPVPLDQHVYIQGDLIEFFADGGTSTRVNPELIGSSKSGGRGPSSVRERRGRARGRGSHRVRREDVVRLLDGHQLLPAIYFI